MDSAIWGFVGVFIGAIVSGGVDYFTQSQQLKHEKKIKQYDLMSEIFKNAVHNVIDVMQARWVSAANPQNGDSQMKYLDAWLKTWKSSAELGMVLPTESVQKYDELVEEVQMIQPEDLHFDLSDVAATSKFRALTASLKEKAEAIFNPFKKIMNDCK